MILHLKRSKEKRKDIVLPFLCDFVAFLTAERYWSIRLLCRFAHSGGFSFRNKFSEGKTSDGTCGKQIPQQCHGEIFQHSADPDGGELCDRGTTHDDIEQDSGNGTHGRAHDENGAAGDDQRAEEGVILLRVDELCRKTMTNAVAPKIGEEENEDPHKRGFDEGIVKDMVCHVAETAGHGAVAKLMGHIENLHAIGHGDGHDDTENDTLQFCFRHK